MPQHIRVHGVTARLSIELTEYLTVDAVIGRGTSDARASAGSIARDRVLESRRSGHDHGSWPNLVEVWFGIIERQALHRADVASVPELNKKIRAFVTGWNDRCHPFVWTKTSTEILRKANRSTTSKTRH